MSMWHVIVKNMKIRFPPVTDGNAHYAEVVRALDVSKFKTGTLYGRLMDNTGSLGNAGFQMKLVGLPYWPDDDANVRVSISGAADDPANAPVLFQPRSPTVLTTSFDTSIFDHTSDLGDVITRLDTQVSTNVGIVASTLSMPAMRVLACFFVQTGGTDFDHGGTISISVGIALNEC